MLRSGWTDQQHFCLSCFFNHTKSTSKWQKDAPNFNIDGHYPVRELWDRASSCWQKILVHDSRSVLVVAHNAVNQALVATAMGTFPFLLIGSAK